jgi:chemotaxis protein CheC
MEKNLCGLTKLHLDALKEISSIGAGNAATALSQFVNKNVGMDPPEVIIATAKEVPALIALDIPKITMIGLDILGEVSGHLLVVFEQNNAQLMVDCLMGQEPGKASDTLSEIDKSALKEVASVMSGSFLRVLGDTINKTLQMSTPDYSSGSPDKISEFILKHSIRESEVTICLKSSLWTADNIKVFVYLVFVPSSASLKVLLKLLGMEEVGAVSVDN